MKYFLLLSISILLASNSIGQSQKINPKYLSEPWEAWWITHPTEDIYGYGVFHFRKSFLLNEKPSEFIVHVSADNRYKLYINGKYVGHGPARGDLLTWYYETIDISSYLKKGNNSIAALVWNVGEYKPMAQISDKTAFIVQGNSALEQIANTGKDWKVIKNKGYSPIIYKDNDPKLNWAYYVAGALDSLNMNYYLHGWNETDYNDSEWVDVRMLDAARPTNFSYHQKWLMSPRKVPLLNEEMKRFSSIARVDGANISAADQNKFITGNGKITLPPNARAVLLFDNDILTNGYPTLITSKGKDSHIQITYAEALFNENFIKEHRDRVEGMQCFGVHDVFIPDGGDLRSFTSLWTRPFRWIELKITTGDEALILNDFYHHFIAYPTEIKAEFSCDNEMLQKIWDASIHTQILSAQETFVSDLAWEQIQYIGDTKVQGLCYLYMTGDEKLFKLALTQLNDSRESNGLTQSRYPCNLIQFTPLYSLVWISMVHDYWMMGQDLAYLEQFLPGIYEVLFWFEKQLNKENMVPTLPYLDFVDSRFFEQREGIIAEKKHQGSTVHTLSYAIALNEAADLFEWFDQQARAMDYRKLAKDLTETTRRLCYANDLKLFSDSPGKKLYSQHSNILAILSNAAPISEQQELIDNILTDSSLLETQMYFHYYLGRAMKKAGAGDRYLSTISAWKEMIDYGVKSFGESKSRNPRSECHAWSTSPAYEFMATICGIEPSSPGFKTIHISPHFNNLSVLDCKIPYLNQGFVELKLNKSNKQQVMGEIVLPLGLTGTYVYNGKTTLLKSGLNKIQ